MKPNSQFRCGIVEGFFSKPIPRWTFAERMSMLRFCAEYAPGLKSYFYCPKQDPRVTDAWAELYEQEELAQLKETVNFCAANGISFTYGLNPALTASTITNKQEREQWFESVRRKLNQIRDIGVRSLALLFDDIPFAYDVVDRSLDTADRIEELVVDLVNSVYRERESELDSFYFCSPDYCLKEATALTDAQKRLAPGIRYIWTGNEIFAPTISAQDCARAVSLLGPQTSLAWWVNYPVNDCEQNVGMFNLGAFLPPQPGCAEYVTEIFVNPMRECHANLPFYCSVSDFAECPDLYSREQSWKKALATVCGAGFDAGQVVIDEFSAPNCVDTGAKYFLGRLERLSDETLREGLSPLRRGLEEIQAVLGRDGVGAQFLDSIAAIFAQSRWYLRVAEDLLANKSITVADFAKGDLFPTLPTEARYCAEITRIVQSRLQRLPATRAPISLPPDALAAVREYEANYKGSSKLSMPADKIEKYRNAALAIIACEQEAMTAFLNCADFAVVDRLKVLSARLNVNRFTLK